MTLKSDANIEEKLICFQKRQEFGEFSHQHSKVSKICTLMRSFWTKHIMFELKKYWRTMFHDTAKWYKDWWKTDLWFGKWHEDIGKFLPEHSKVSKLQLWRDPFIQNRKCMSLKFAEELRVMKKKNDAKFEEDLTCLFKIDMRDLTNFDLSTKSLKNLHFNALLLTKVYNV